MVDSVLMPLSSWIYTLFKTQDRENYTLFRGTYRLDAPHSVLPSGWIDWHPFQDKLITVNTPRLRQIGLGGLQVLYLSSFLRLSKRNIYLMSED